MRNQGIERIMSAPAVSVNVGNTVLQAKVLMESLRINHLPVVDEGKLVGLISSADFLKLFLLDQGRNFDAAIAVEQIMEKNPIALTKNDRLRDAAEKLSVGGFHSLPVIDEDRNLVGIVTSTDLIKHMLHHIPTGDGSLNEKSDIGIEIRAKMLEEVYRAAEKFIRSGHAEREHSVLIKALQAANDSGTTEVAI